MTKVGSVELVRHSYDGVLTAASRLMAFSSANPSSIPGLIHSYQTILSKDDLILFAIHARRLIENTVKQANVAEEKIERTDGQIGLDYPLTRIINVIVHNVQLEVVRSEQEVRILSRIFTDTDFFTANIKYLRQPVCVAVSDKGQHIHFQIGDMIVSFERKVLMPIVEFCSSQGIHLESHE